MQADIKGDIYEGLLAKSAAESPKGAGQYFMPRELIHSIVKCVEPPPRIHRLRSGMRYRRLYDLRTNMHFTLKTNPLKRTDLDEFATLYKPEEPREKRRQNWSEEKNPDGRWRSFDYDEIIKRDKANLDIFWLKDDSLEDSENLPDPQVLAQEIADDLQTALEQFASIAAELNE